MNAGPAALQLNFGKVLRRLRTERELSQMALALEADIDRTYISLSENGLRQPTLTTLVALGAALHVDPVELVRLTLAPELPAAAKPKKATRKPR